MSSELSLDDRIKNLHRRLAGRGKDHPRNISHDKLYLIALAGQDVWNAWFEHQPPPTTLDFSNFDFNRNPIDFSSFVFRTPEDNSACVSFRKTGLHSANKFHAVVFETQADFREASFGADADFGDAIFMQKADFTDTRFGNDASFKATRFHGDALFAGCAFDNACDFSDAAFKGLADFQSKWLGHRISFDRTRFHDRAEFASATFGNLATFNSTKFHDLATFKGAKFGMSCTFAQSGFDGHADFGNAKFLQSADFGGARFDSYADFNRAHFGDRASFSSAHFKSPALFTTSTLGNDADFTGAIFHEKADFTEASLEDRPRFANAKIHGSADFHAVSVGNDANFECMEFSRTADFSSSIRTNTDKGSQEFQAISFAGTKFLGDTIFEGRKFKSTTRFGRPNDAPIDTPATTFDGIPNFHGCELHQDTDFHSATFRESFDVTRASDAARAYRTLKLAMEKAKATREEQRFFRLEMKAEHPSLAFWPRLMSSIYATTSDYGFSLRRPLVGLALTALLIGAAHGALINASAGHEGLQTLVFTSPDADVSRTWQWLRYVAINTLPVPGFDKTQMELRDALFGKDGVIVSVAMGLEMLHKVVSLGCVFLLGLALRNLFKMKS